jgi:hypothetical protein
MHCSLPERRHVIRITYLRFVPLNCSRRVNGDGRLPHTLSVRQGWS